MNGHVSRWLPLAGWLALVVSAVVCADEGWASRWFGCVSAVPLGDKVGHFFLIGTLAWLLNRALLNRRFAALLWQVQIGSLIIAVVMTLEEVSQVWIPGRTFDFGDMAANFAGIMCAGWLACSRPETPATLPQEP